MKARVLSQAGKSILIKSNLTGSPLFTMQRIKIPNYVAKEMDKMNKDFFWQNNMDSNNNHGSLQLVSWDKVCQPKCEGVLGIREVRDVMQLL